MQGILTVEQGREQWALYVGHGMYQGSRTEHSWEDRDHGDKEKMSLRTHSRLELGDTVFR
jgi:hypothetical protein